MEEVLDVDKILKSAYMYTGMVTSAAPTRDLSADDLSLLNVLHSDPTSITLQIYVDIA